MKLRTGSLLLPLLLGTRVLAAVTNASPRDNPPDNPLDMPPDTSPDMPPDTSPDRPPAPATVTPSVTAPPATPAPSSGSTVVEDVVSGPFKDLNLVKKDIPPVLVDLHGQPYNPPEDGTCHGLATEVTALDAVLGPDLDVLTPAGKSTSSAAAKALTQASHSLVPYRSWIRKLSGAEKRAERLAAALLAGTARRAFLKGLGVAQGCAPPAAPLPRVPAMEPERAPAPGA